MRFDERRLARVAAACAMVLWPTMAAAQRAGDASRPLEGRWRVDLTIDVADKRFTPTARDVKGEIAFDSTTWWNPGDRWGRHTVDLSPFFGRTGALPKGVTPFSATDTSMVTELTGRMAGPMVTVEFMPRTSRYGITLEGRLVGDSVVGQWHRRGMDGAGTFAMNRISREPVKVAAINDPILNPALRVAAGTPKPAAANARGASARAAAATAKTPPVRTPAVAAAAAPRQTPPASAAASRVATTVPATAGAPGSAPAQTGTVAASSGTPAVTAPAAAGTPTPAAPAATRSGAVDPAVTGDLRVRLYDRASKQYVATTYQLQLANNQWMWGDMKTGGGADGWGPAVTRPAGTHRVVIDNFVCGDKYWFFARPISKPVEVVPGQPTEVTLEVDLSAEPAKKSYDNPKGVTCAAGPGSK